ncbi:MAG: protein kinase [Candidatus Eisenbacteria bacterium]
MIESSADAPRQIGIYEIEGTLGRGGMGVVLLARDPRLGRRVALKLISGRIAHDPEWNARFVREARTLASLNHPNIATIHSLDRDGTIDFLTMEYIEGRSLAAVISSGDIAMPDALSICRQIARGLEAAHQVGVIHRDLKPLNVMVGPDGHVKLLDFGLATTESREISDAETILATEIDPSEMGGEGSVESDATVLVSDASARASAVSGSTASTGTPGYISPEQVVGATLDARSDLWAFGAVLFECLSGVRAFDGETGAERIRRSMSGSYDPSRLPSNTPAAVRDLVMRCLKRRREERPAAASELRAVLDAALAAREWEAREAGTTDATPGGRPRTNLPRQLSSFVGRGKELAAIRAMLDQHRLVTITGAGGAGKTRAALQVAEAKSAEDSAEVWLVELAPMSDPAFVPAAVARALGVTESPGQPLADAIVANLANRELLLLLDNCEHLVESAANLVSRLLRSSAGLRVLATSREALGIPGEAIFPLPPLALNEPEAGQAESTESEAVLLFAERARQVQPSFRVDSTNLDAVVEICRRLDAMPLAIELAAARVRALSPREIAKRLDDRFRLLRGGARGEDRRHQTLEAMIDWSHALLSDGEQRLLRRLSVFRGGWTLEAAEAICADETLESWEVLDLLSRLIEKSLVVFHQGRYSLLETVREYAAARLRGAEDHAAVRERCQEYFLGFARGAAEKLIGPEQGEWLARLDADVENIRACIAWSVDRGETNRSLRLAGGLVRYWLIRAQWREGRDTITRALALPPQDESLLDRASALNGLASFLFALRELDAAIPVYRQTIEMARAAGSLDRAGTTLQNLGNIYRQQGKHEEAAEAFREALECVDPNNTWVRSAIQMNLGTLALTLEKYDEGEAHLLKALELQASTGDRVVEGVVVMHLGLVAFRRKRMTEARDLYLRANAIFEDLSDRNMGSFCDANLSGALFALGDIDGAERRTLRALRSVKNSGELELNITCLEQLGWFACHRRRFDSGVRLLGAAEAARLRLNIPRVAVEMREWNESLEAIRSKLDAAEFDRHWQAGGALDLPEATALGLSAAP